MSKQLGYKLDIIKKLSTEKYGTVRTNFIEFLTFTSVMNTNENGIYVAKFMI